MVDCCDYNSDLRVQSYQGLVGLFNPIEMRRSSSLLYRSRGTEHTYGRHNALSTSSNDMASSDISWPKGSFVYHFHDRSLVSLPSQRR